MQNVTEHYASDGLTARILESLIAGGVDQRAIDECTVDPDVLAGADEFHLGGRAATEQIVSAVGASTHAPRRILDVGSGIGGSARRLARSLQCQVSGIDLTAEFVETAAAVSEVVGASEATDFAVGSATNIPFDPDTFDAVTMFHVGMNIEAKTEMASEFARVVRPSGAIVIYDIMRVGEGEITFPVPWATSSESSFVATPADYGEVLESAGFVNLAVADQRDLVLAVMKATSEGPPNPVNLGVVMGSEFPTMIKNLMRLVHASVLSPIMITATAPGEA